MEVNKDLDGPKTKFTLFGQSWFLATKHRSYKTNPVPSESLDPKTSSGKDVASLPDVAGDKTLTKLLQVLIDLVVK